MPQFTNTKRVGVIEKVTEGFKQRLDSPYNILQQQKAYVVDYWNQSLENSTSDPASNLIYKPTGPESPLRFNKINRAIMYGLPQFQIDLEIGDFGLESGSYSGESTILPNTWIPYPGDFFLIRHADNERLFSVTAVTPDTLPNGANYYRIQYEFSTKTISELNSLTVETFNFIFDNVGTKFAAVVKSSLYDEIADLEQVIDTLQIYYNDIFFQNNVQTFVYRYNEYNFYDPYMIEFLRRNNVLDTDRDCTFISHAVPISKTFSIEYDRTFLRAIELGDINIKMYQSAVAQYIDNKLSLFYFRSSDYYKIEYRTNLYADEVPVIDVDLLERIKENRIYEGYDENTYKNIIIKYFNNDIISKAEIDSLKEIDFSDNMSLFYNVPIIIFILQKSIRDSISRKNV